MRPVQNDVFELPPENFDAREKWANYIHPVRDQGDCGASWAFSTVGKEYDNDTFLYYNVSKWHFVILVSIWVSFVILNWYIQCKGD